MDGAGTLPDRWALAAGRASSKGCIICHGPRLPGARLCVPCKAALKRARLETVSELVPLPSRAAAEAEAARRRAKALAVAQATTPRRRGKPRLTVLGVVVAAMIAGGYVALRSPRPAGQSQVVPLARVPHSVPMPAARTEPAHVVVAPEAKPVVEPPVPPPQAAGAPHPPLHAAQKRVVSAPSVPSAPPVDRFPVATEPVAVAPPAMPDVRLPAAEAPAPDRWQVMADQVARCGRDGFFAGVICEQRVRLKYCDGYWGVAAQCPSGIPNDHGG